MRKPYQGYLSGVVYLLLKLQPCLQDELQDIFQPPKIWKGEISAGEICPCTSLELPSPTALGRS